VRQVAKAFPGKVYAVPALSPAQPPAVSNQIGWLAEGEGWIDLLRKCSRQPVLVAQLTK